MTVEGAAKTFCADRARVKAENNCFDLKTVLKENTKKLEKEHSLVAQKGNSETQYFQFRKREKPQKQKAAESSRRINMHSAAIRLRAKEGSKGT